MAKHQKTQEKIAKQRDTSLSTLAKRAFLISPRGEILANSRCCTSPSARSPASRSAQGTQPLACSFSQLRPIKPRPRARAASDDPLNTTLLVGKTTRSNRDDRTRNARQPASGRKNISVTWVDLEHKKKSTQVITNTAPRLLFERNPAFFSPESESSELTQWHHAASAPRIFMHGRPVVRALMQRMRAGGASDHHRRRGGERFTFWPCLCSRRQLAAPPSPCRTSPPPAPSMPQRPPSNPPAQRTVVVIAMIAS